MLTEITNWWLVEFDERNYLVARDEVGDLWIEQDLMSELYPFDLGLPTRAWEDREIVATQDAMSRLGAPARHEALARRACAILDELAGEYDLPPWGDRNDKPALVLTLPTDVLALGVYGQVTHLRLDDAMPHEDELYAFGTILCRLLSANVPLVIDELIDEFDVPDRNVWDLWVEAWKSVPHLAGRIGHDDEKIWLESAPDDDEPSAAELHRLYWDEGMTLGQLGEKFGTTGAGMRHIFEKNNIPRRGRGRPPKTNEEE